ncbi:efflux RND transporter periplasmic adaptor subunit [Paludibacterium sp. THUN1379]|nr:efflux RND transporter periplasmic adaptor subunit [Paludibacterium sp. THUN1379]
MTFTALLCLACSDKKPVAEPPLPQVVFQQPIQREVTDTIQLDGTVAPSESVNLVARVSGYLQSAPFAEGAQVKQGQLLFVIEPDPYQQQVKLNQAKLDQARSEYQRQQVLMKENATAQSSVESALSNLQQAEANLRLAQINLDYTAVRAPFDGVIGKRTVDVGNYVGAGAGGTVLATLTRLRPAYVNFSVNERDLLRLRKAGVDKEGTAKAGVGKIKVGAALQGEATPSETGELDFIDNTLAAATGSLQLRAKFDNKDLHLIPGLYSKVFIGISKPHQALLVPSSVVLNDQLGNYVYVVDADSKVVRRNVKTGADFDQLREITDGISASDRVITQGLSNVGVGQKVAAQADSGKPAQ